MARIIHASEPGKVLNFARDGEKPSSFIHADSESGEKMAFLTSWGLKEIGLDEIHDEERRLCEKEYINSIALLSAKKDSVRWWANSLSEKNEHISQHYRNLFLFYRLIKTITRLFDANISLFVICNPDLAKQVACYCRRNNIQFESLDNRLMQWIKNRGSNLLYTFMACIYLIMNMAVRKMLLPGSLRTRIQREIGGINSYYVIRTWLDDRFGVGADSSFLPFFGKLPQYVMQKGYNFILLAGIIGNYRDMVRRIKDFRNFLIIPEEFFINYSDLVRLIPYLHFRRVRLNETVLFNGLDVTALCEEEINKGFLNPEYLKNILRFFMAKRFAGNVRFSHYVQTFENYAWEKMMILGMRETGSPGKILGFQHAFISRNSFKYFPGKSELGIIPLPDGIITRGEITREIMDTYGSYPPDILTTGCALRQEYLREVTLLNRGRHNKIVVPLTMVPRESGLILNFLIESGLPAMDIEVVIRCHPMAPFNTFKKYVNHVLPANFIISNEKSVQQELTTTDIVLYTWTTVAVEAITMGIPVIFLDILSPLYVEPLFECSSLKRIVNRPNDLLSCIQELYAMSDAEFLPGTGIGSGIFSEGFLSGNRRKFGSFFCLIMQQEFF